MLVLIVKLELNLVFFNYCKYNKVYCLFIFFYFVCGMLIDCG